METSRGGWFQFCVSGSYRTYEEWKRSTITTGHSPIFQVLTVPMRNGNYISYSCAPLPTIVLTVPMRNGNYISIFHLYHKIPFLPYLWGMETCSPRNSKHLCNILFLPYLWGMETTRVVEKSPENLFLPYLWGMETYIRGVIKMMQIPFLPYLWGMETIAFSKVAKVDPWVLTVPMRNGNLNICSKSK